MIVLQEGSLHLSLSEERISAGQGGAGNQGEPVGLVLLTVCAGEVAAPLCRRTSMWRHVHRE